METIISDFSLPVLERAIKANWADYYRQLGHTAGAELSVGPFLTWFLSGIPDPFMNVVLRTRPMADRAGEIIDQTLTHFREQNVKRLSWWAETNHPGTDLDRQLLDHGLTFKEGGAGMAANLLGLPQDLPIPAGLSIVQVEDERTLLEWIHIVSVSFGIPLFSERRFFELLASLGYERPVRSYLAYLNGLPVATSQLFLSAGVAGLYNMTCLPGARRLGIGAAVTWLPLLEARKLGYRISTLQASPLGYPIYHQLGFQDFGKLNFYLWENRTKSADM